MIHSIFPVQITCLPIFLHNLSPRSFWSTSWSGALRLIFHTFLHPISGFFSQHVLIPSQPVLLLQQNVFFTGIMFSHLLMVSVAMLIWLCLSEKYCSQSQNQCDMVICCCYNKACVPYAISRASYSAISSTLHRCTGL